MGRRLALVIGNSKFEDETINPLSSPHYDLREMTQVLGHPKLGDFEVLTLEDRTVSTLKIQTKNFFKECNEDDILLLYYSGHGLIDTSRQLYFAASDTQKIHLDETALSHLEIIEKMNSSPSKQKVVILDCCYSAVGIDGAKVAPIIDTPIELDIDPSTLARQTEAAFIITATEATEIAREDKKKNGPSLFTKHLLEGLKTGKADADHDGSVSIDEMYFYVYSNVVEESQNQQKPQMRPYPHERIKFHISHNDAYELLLFYARLENGVFDLYYEPIFSSENSKDHLHLDGMPLSFSLPPLYFLPNNIQKIQEVTICLYRQSLINKEDGIDEETIVKAVKIKPTQSPLKLECSRNSPTSSFEIKCIDDTGVILSDKVINNSIGRDEIVRIMEIKAAKVLFILDGTMQGDNLERAKIIIQKYSESCLNSGLPVEFGCIVYGEYLYKYYGTAFKHANFSHETRRQMPFEIYEHEFGTISDLEAFLDPLKPSDGFLGQDSANALELAFRAANRLNWQQGERYAILLGTSYPHPLIKERAEKGLIDWCTEEFAGISWFDEIQTLKRDVPFTMGLWFPPQIGYLEQEQKFVREVWTTFDVQEEWREVNDISNHDRRAEKLFFAEFQKRQQPRLSGVLKFPLMEPFRIVNSDIG